MSHRFSWDYQRAFLAVIEEGSLSGAARRLGVSQPTLRGWIAALEAEFGTVLFTRSANGLTPTDTAKALAEPARAMSRASDLFQRSATAPPGEVAGTVRLSVSDTMGIEVVPPMLATLRAKHPDITIELEVSNKPADLLGQAVDLAVRTFAPEQGALIARKVGAIPLGFFASPGYLDRCGSPKTLEDLANHDIAGPDRASGDLQLGVKATPGVRPARYVLRTDSHPARIAAARAGLGITIMQVPIGARDPRLRRILPGVVATRLETWIVTHEDLKAVPKVRVVFDHLFAAFADYIAEAGDGTSP